MVSGDKQVPLLRIADLTKTYVQGRWCEKHFHIKALDRTNLVLEQGQRVSLVGRSGSGKTTLAMCAALLERPDSGSIWFNGRDVQSLAQAERAVLRAKLQICFQDSTALPARYTARQIIEEPLRIQRRYSTSERAELVSEFMEAVGLPAKWGDRLPDQFSGGQRQRIAIARSLTLRPDLLILDEPFVGLDMMVRGQIVNLLLDLQEAHSLTYLCVSHDLELVRRFSDSIAVMDRGKIIEQCSASDLFDHIGQAQIHALGFRDWDFRERRPTAESVDKRSVGSTARSSAPNVPPATHQKNCRPDVSI